MISRLCVVALAASALAFAQLDTNTVTVTASQNLTVQPDQILFSVSVTSGIGSGLSDVLNALQPVGVTAAGFVGVTSVQSVCNTPAQPGGVCTGPAPQLQWSFTLPAALAGMKSTITALTNLQQSITQNNSGFTLSFSIAGTQVSPQLQQMQVCPLAELMSSAQLQAQKLANVAGASLGAVLALAGSTPNTSASGSNFIEVGAYTSVQSFSTPTVCSMTVKFSLLH